MVVIIIINRNFVFFALLLSTILISGCSQPLTEEQLYTKLIEANTNIDTYKIELDSDATMSMQMMGEDMTLNYQMLTEGVVDRNEKELYLSSTIKSAMTGMKTEMESDIYIIGNDIYMSMMGSWMKMTYDSEIWTQNDQVAQMTSLVENSKIEILEDDSFDGNDYYVVKLEPDMDALAESIMSQQNLGTDYDASSLGKMVQEYTSTLWINKKTFHIEKSSTTARMVLSSEEPRDDEQTMDIDYTLDIRMRDINKPVSIELPSEAKTATEISGSSGSLASSPMTGFSIMDMIDR